MATFLLLISAQHRACRVLLPHSLPFLTPKLTCGLLVPVLDQGLVEMNFFITIQPSSLGITVADVSAAGFINSLRLMYHVPFMFLGCCTSTILQPRCCWRRSAAGQPARSSHARARARCARCGDQRARVVLFSRASCYVMFFGSWYLSSS